MGSLLLVDATDTSAGQGIPEITETLSYSQAENNLSRTNRDNNVLHKQPHMLVHKAELSLLLCGTPEEMRCVAHFGEAPRRWSSRARRARWNAVFFFFF